MLRYLIPDSETLLLVEAALSQFYAKYLQKCKIYSLISAITTSFRRLYLLCARQCSIQL